MSWVAAADDPPPVELSAQEDHARLMKLLGMKLIRRGADGNNPNAPNAANYDESKANPYPHLPDPLLTQDRRVSTPRDVAEHAPAGDRRTVRTRDLRPRSW